MKLKKLKLISADERLRRRGANRRFQIFALVACLALAVMFVTQKLLAQSVPPPVLQIVATNGTQFELTITNAVASTNYQIYWTPVLGNTNFPWQIYFLGSIGQSNFTADMGIYSAGFFKASIGDDWDLDGIPNFQDADQLDVTLGVLSLTIDSPTNGATLQ